MTKVSDPQTRSGPYTGAHKSAGSRRGSAKGTRGARGNSGWPTSPAACSSAAHRPENLETAWWCWREEHGQETERDVTGEGNGRRRDAPHTRRDLAAPPLPLPGREPTRPAPPLLIADKGTRDLPAPASRPSLAVGGLCHSRSSPLRTTEAHFRAQPCGSSRRRRPRG